MKNVLKSSLALLLVLTLLAACAGAGEYHASEPAPEPASAAAEAVTAQPEEPENPEEAAQTEVAESPEEAAPAGAEDGAVSLDNEPEPTPQDAEAAEEAEQSPEALTAQDTVPKLAMRVVPPVGSTLPVQGVVIDSDGNAVQGGSYRVTLYVELTQYNTFWVKPSESTPFVKVNSDGSFSLRYDGAGVSDRKATRLHILLLPADYTPTLHGIQEARANALDYVQVDRDAQGGVSVTPERQAPAIAPGKSSGLKVSESKIAVNVGFYTQGQPGDALTEAQIRTLLGKVQSFADIVRFYEAGGETGKAYQIAKDLGLQVVGTAWLSGNAQHDREELDALIGLCNQGLVRVACVGSETLIRKDLTPEQLIADLNYVRDRLTDKSIPVTTADSVGELLNAPDVLGACDLVLPNVYPYWEGVAVEGAGAAFASALADLRACCGSKEILVSETGWPTEGESKQDAVASDANAAAYFQAVRAWSLEHQTVVLWFDAADEPWKRSNEGEAGAHWGVLTKDLAVKGGFGGLALFQNVPTGTEDPGNQTDPTGTEDPGNQTDPTGVTKPTLKSVKNARGGVELGWNKAQGAVRYELCCKSGKTWKTVGKNTKTKLLVKTYDGKHALRSGKRYTFAVRAVDASGAGALSDGRSQVYVAAPKWKTAKNDRKGAVTARWKAVSGVTGYQVQCAADKAFSKGRKTVTIAKGKATSGTITGLKKGKSCLLRLRSWKSVSGKKVYSGWSAAKKVKIGK